MIIPIHTFLTVLILDFSFLVHKMHYNSTSFNGYVEFLWYCNRGCASVKDLVCYLTKFRGKKSLCSTLNLMDWAYDFHVFIILFAAISGSPKGNFSFKTLITFKVIEVVVSVIHSGSTFRGVPRLAVQFLLEFLGRYIVFYVNA